MKMVPSTLPGEPHPSEQKIFDQLKHSPGRWTVFPNFYVTNQENPARPRELDFVILIPKSCSVIYLEAKGGRYEFSNREMRRVGAKENELRLSKQVKVCTP